MKMKAIIILYSATIYDCALPQEAAEKIPYIKANKKYREAEIKVQEITNIGEEA